MEKWYVSRLLKDLKSLDKKIYVISTPEINNLYDVFPKEDNTKIFNGSIQEVCDLISNCTGFIGVDSAFRLVSQSFDKPTLTLSKNCQGHGQIAEYQQIRWLCWPELTFGLHYSTTEIVGLMKKMLSNKIYQLFPKIQEPWEKYLIKRDYSVDFSKTK